VTDEDIIITITASLIPTYGVYFPAETEWEGYLITDITGSLNGVTPGSVVTFKVSLTAGYENLVVKSNDVLLTPEGGVYKVTVTGTDETVTVSASLISTYSVTIPSSAAGYTVSDITGGLAGVTSGSVVTFKVSLTAGYENLVVKANGIDLEPESGVYKVTVANANVTVTISASLIPTYSVTIPASAAGYTVSDITGEISGRSSGDIVTFKVSLTAGYESLVVKANGITLTPEDGVYTVTVANADVTVTISSSQIHVEPPKDKDDDGGIFSNPLILVAIVAIIVVAIAAVWFFVVRK
jgi:hypothetical protein